MQGMLDELEAFVSALSRALRAAPNTALNYRRDLMDFRRFLLDRAGGDEVVTGEINADDIRGLPGRPDEA